jgi:ABC-type branched-subunit amino acid transport system permease subunit
MQIFPEGFFGFTEVVLAVVLILILIFRPTGIMGSRELRWPRRRGSARPAEPAEPEG